MVYWQGLVKAELQFDRNVLFDLRHLGHACLSHHYGQYQLVLPIVSCHIIIQVFIYKIRGVRESSDVPFKLLNILLCMMLIMKEHLSIVMTNSIFFGFERTVAGFDDARFISGGGGVGWGCWVAWTLCHRPHRQPTSTQTTKDNII